MARLKLKPPQAGQIFYCNYDGPPGRPPEMAKGRKVVVVSRYNANLHGTCVVVPFSSRSDHEEIPEWWVLISSEKCPYLTIDSWAKSDLSGHVSLDRLSPIRFKGERIFPFLDEDSLNEIRKSFINLLSLN